MKIHLRHEKCWVWETTEMPFLPRIGDTIVCAFAWERCSKEYIVIKVSYNSKGEDIEVIVKGIDKF